jgi:hypothetical protein
VDRQNGQTKEQTEAAAREAVIRFVERSSAAGRLVTVEDIRSELAGANGPVERGLDLDAFGQFLKETVVQNEELKEIAGGDGVARYYSGRAMTDAYAGLLIRKGQDPLLLVTDIVRENSRLYPRPVPLGMFGDAPFDLTPEEVSSCLGKMAGREEYGDIHQTTTSIGTVFLYSTLHLEPDYASFLAEWIDVGQLSSP